MTRFVPLLFFLYLASVGTRAELGQSEGAEPYRFSTPVIFIPGIMGSKLEKDGKVLWGDSVWTMKGEFEKLALPLDLSDDGVQSTGVLTELRVVGGIVKIKEYTAILDSLRKAGLKDDKTLFVFHYDWRRSNRQSAAELAKRVEQWRAQLDNPDTRFRIVAHSMGGLVAKYYVARLGGHKHVDRLILLGTPNDGSAKSVMMMRGGLLDDEVNAFLGEAKVRKVVRTFPSTYELFPRLKTCCYWVSGQAREPIDLFSVDTWRKLDWIYWDNGEAERGWAFVADRLRDAQDFHHLLTQNALPVEIHKVVGYTQPTLESLEVSRSGNAYVVSQKLGPGDGTVTIESARLTDPRRGDAETNVQRVAEKHGSIYADPFAKQTIIDLVRDYQPPSWQERYSNASNDVTSVALAAVTLNKAYYTPGSAMRLAIDVKGQKGQLLPIESVSFALQGVPVELDTKLSNGATTYGLTAPTVKGTYELVVSIKVRGVSPLQVTELFEVVPR